MSSRAWAIIVAILTITFVLSPAFTEPFMGYTTEQLPFVVENPPIQPAGYAFSIWGVIYTWLLVSAGFGLWKRRDDASWDTPRMALTLSLAVGTFWLWIANQSAIWGSISIVFMMVTALAAMIATPKKDIWWLAVPVALYAGWLSAASIVSVMVSIAGYGYSGWITSALIGIAIAVALACIIQRRRPAVFAYSIPVVWALIAIVVANMGGAMMVQIFAGVAAVIVTLFAATSYIAARP